MDQRLLVITPVHNEAARIGLVAAAMARQTRRPERWIVIDDNSTDSTPAVLEGLVEEVPFMEIRRARRRAEAGDHLALAAEARAFNQALAGVDLADFSHVAKLDGDIELSDTYFQDLLGRFAADPRLGLAGGCLFERTRDSWRLTVDASEHHVRGALKCYSVPCLEAIGGIEEQLGWDTIDDIRARMTGFRTASFPDIVAWHHRPLGSAQGTLRGRARHGRCEYIAHFPLWWVTLRSLKSLGERPLALGGLAFLTGYLRAALSGEPRVPDPAFRRWVHDELDARARGALRRPRLAARGAGVSLQPSGPRHAQRPSEDTQGTGALSSSQTLSDHL